MIMADRRVTIDEVASSLNISHGSAHQIFHYDLWFHEVCVMDTEKPSTNWILWPWNTLLAAQISLPQTFISLDCSRRLWKIIDLPQKQKFGMQCKSGFKTNWKPSSWKTHESLWLTEQSALLKKETMSKNNINAVDKNSVIFYLPSYLTVIKWVMLNIYVICSRDVPNNDFG